LKRKNSLRLTGMILASAGALTLMVSSVILWTTYLQYGTLVTGFSRVSLFLFGVLPMGLLALRFIIGDKARSEDLYTLILFLLFVNQAVLAVQNGAAFWATGYTRWKFVRSVALAAGIAGMLLDAFLKDRWPKRLLGFISAGFTGAVWLWWIIAVLITAIPAAKYSEGLLKFGILECLQMFSRVLFLSAAGCYLKNGRRP